MEIDLIKRSIRLDRQRLEDTSSDLLIQKNIGKTAVIGRSRAIKERINKNIMVLEKELVTLTKKWFIDRDLEHGGRLDKQSLKLSEEFGELCAGFLKKNEALTKDSIGDCAVVVVGLALLIKEDVHAIFEESDNIRRKDAMECFKLLNANISEFQLSQDLASKEMCRHNLVRAVAYLKSISKALGYDFVNCFELAYNEIKDRKGKWIDGSFVKEEDLPNEV
nr:MAG TPA: NTP-PPase-like protein [Caudoviricetes sp.]